MWYTLNAHVPCSPFLGTLLEIGENLGDGVVGEGGAAVIFGDDIHLEDQCQFEIVYSECARIEYVWFGCVPWPSSCGLECI